MFCCLVDSHCKWHNVTRSKWNGQHDWFTLWPITVHQYTVFLAITLSSLNHLIFLWFFLLIFLILFFTLDNWELNCVWQRWKTHSRQGRTRENVDVISAELFYYSYISLELSSSKVGIIVQKKKKKLTVWAENLVHGKVKKEVVKYK